jgi:hypothetical protein
MERQFAAMDSVRTFLRSSDLPGLEMVAVLQRDGLARLPIMVGKDKISLPVLLDDPELVFEKVYGAAKKRAFFFFDRKGCLLAGGIEGDLSVRSERTRIIDDIMKAYK